MRVTIENWKTGNLYIYEHVVAIYESERTYFLTWFNKQDKIIDKEFDKNKYVLVSVNEEC